MATILGIKLVLYYIFTMQCAQKHFSLVSYFFPWDTLLTIQVLKIRRILREGGLKMLQLLVHQCNQKACMCIHGICFKGVFNPVLHLTSLFHALPLALALAAHFMYEKIFSIELHLCSLILLSIFSPEMKPVFRVKALQLFPLLGRLKGL